MNSEDIIRRISPFLESVTKPTFVDGRKQLAKFKNSFTPAQRQTFEKKIFKAAEVYNMHLDFTGMYGTDAVITLLNNPNIPMMNGMLFMPKKGDVFFVYPIGDIGTINSYDLIMYAKRNDLNYIKNNLNLLIL